MNAVNARIKGAIVSQIDVEYFSQKKIPACTEDGGMDWNWFQKNLTLKAFAQGFNVVVYHCTRKERTKFGFRKNLNGAYRTDDDTLLEFWMSADYGQKAKHYKNYTEFRRVFMHELLHGFFRFTGIKSDLVHNFDYGLRNVEDGFGFVRFK
jgi:hypothetical protein